MSSIFQEKLSEHHTMLFSHYDDVINYCRSSKAARELCRNKYFWQEKARIEFGISSKEFNDTFLSPNNRYFQLLIEHEGVARQARSFMTIQEFIERAVKYQRDELIDELVEEGYPDNKFICKMYAKYGRLDKLDSCVNWTVSDLYAIALDGQLDILRYVISLVEQPFEYEELLPGAVTSGNRELIWWIVEHLPNNANWDYVFGIILESGDKDLLDYVLPHVSMQFEDDYTRAYKSGNIDFINYVEQQLKPTKRFQKAEFRRAVESGNLDLIMKYPKQYLEDVDVSIVIGSSENPDLIRYLTSNVDPDQLNWYELFDGIFSSDDPLPLLQAIPEDILIQVKDELQTFIYDKEKYTTLSIPKYLRILKYLKQIGLRFTVPGYSITGLLKLQDKTAFDIWFDLLISGQNADWVNILKEAEEINPKMAEYLKGVILVKYGSMLDRDYRNEIMNV